MVEKSKTPEVSDVDVRAAIAFVQNNCSYHASEGVTGGFLTQSATLPNGTELKCDYWEYEAEEADINTKESIIPAQEIAPHVIKMLNEGGEIKMITGSSDDTLAVRIFVENPQTKEDETKRIRKKLPL